MSKIITDASVRNTNKKKEIAILQCWNQTFIRHGSVITLSEETTATSASEMTADFIQDIRKPYTLSQNAQRCWCISMSHRPAMYR